MLGYAVVTNNSKKSQQQFIEPQCPLWFNNDFFFNSATRLTVYDLFGTYLSDGKEKIIIDRIMQWLLQLLLRKDLSNFHISSNRAIYKSSLPSMEWRGRIF